MAIALTGLGLSAAMRALGLLLLGEHGPAPAGLGLLALAGLALTALGELSRRFGRSIPLHLLAPAIALGAALELSLGLGLAALALGLVGLRLSPEEAPQTTIPRLGPLVGAAAAAVIAVGAARLLGRAAPGPALPCGELTLLAALVGAALPRRAAVLLLVPAALWALALAIPPEFVLGFSVGESPGNELIFAKTGLLMGADHLLAILVLACAGGNAASDCTATELGVGAAAGAGLCAALLSIPVATPALVGGAAVLALLANRRWLLSAAALPGLALPLSTGMPITAAERVVWVTESLEGAAAYTTRDQDSILHFRGARMNSHPLSVTAPMLLGPEPKRVLVLGHGAAVEAVGRHPLVQDLVVVEPDATTAAAWEAARQPLSSAARLALLREPIPRFLAEGGQGFDIVLINLDVDRLAEWLSVEALEALSARLNPGAILGFRLDTMNLSREGFLRVVGTVDAAFPDGRSALFVPKDDAVLAVYTAPPSWQTLRRNAGRAHAAYGSEQDRELLDALVMGPSLLAGNAGPPIPAGELPSLRAGPLTEANDATAQAWIAENAQVSCVDARKELFGMESVRPPSVEVPPPVPPRSSPGR